MVTCQGKHVMVKETTVSLDDYVKVQLHNLIYFILSDWFKLFKMPIPVAGIHAEIHQLTSSGETARTFRIFSDISENIY